MRLAMNEQIIVMRLLDSDRLESELCRAAYERRWTIIWDDKVKKRIVIQKNNELKVIYDTFHKMELSLEETSLLFEMCKEEPDEEVVPLTQ